MSFSPVVPFGGFAGWRFLERTLDRQSESHARNPAAMRDEAHFRSRIGTIGTPADLVADRRLLSTALTAFGLLDDLPNRAFIHRVLESDTTDRRSFVNRLADKRYLELARSFGFGDAGGAKIGTTGFAEAILARARAQRFEAAIGEQDEGLRLALALQRDLPRIAREAGSDDAAWYTVLGTPSLRKVFETAFGLPREFATLDLDRQVDTLRRRTTALTGAKTLAQFTDSGPLEKLTRRYLVGTQLAEMRQISPGSSALTLLQAIQPLPRPLG